METITQKYKMYVGLNDDGKRIAVSAKDAKALGAKLEELEAGVIQPTTWEEVKQLKGYSETLAVACLSNYLRHHVLQGKMRTDQLAGKLQAEYELFFPDGVRAPGKKVDDAYLTMARDKIRGLAPADRTKLGKALMEAFPDIVESYEGEESLDVILLAHKLKIALDVTKM